MKRLLKRTCWSGLYGGRKSIAHPINPDFAWKISWCVWRKPLFSVACYEIRENACIPCQMAIFGAAVCIRHVCDKLND